MKGRLGTGEYEAYVLTRGGKNLVAVVDWSQITWDRRLDDTSEARLTVDSESIGSLAGTRPWRHELGIYRGGEQIWGGPVINPSAPISGDHQGYQLVARDLSAWFDHRRIHNDYDFAAVDLSVIFQAFVEDAMAPDNSPGLMVNASPCGVFGSYTILAAQHVIAGQPIRDLSNIGIDWTVVVREMLAGGTAVPTKSLGTFTDDYYQLPADVNFDGSAQANSWLIRGSGGGTAGDTIYASAADDAAAASDGLLESVDTISTIQDYASSLAAAKSRLALTGQVKTIQNGALREDAPVELADLVPGALARFEIGGDIPVSDEFRLQRLDVTVSASDGYEKVVPSFQPIGTL